MRRTKKPDISFLVAMATHLRKVLSLAGLNLIDCYICSLRPLIGTTYDTKVRFNQLLHELEQFKPAIIVPLGDEMLNLILSHDSAKEPKTKCSL